MKSKILVIFLALTAFVFTFTSTTSAHQNHKAPPTLPGVPDFNATDAEEEGYWYSRYNLLSLVMQSGNGQAFMPDPATMMAAIQAVDADPNDGDTVVPPANPAMLRIVYAGGDPHLTQMMDPSDFATLRWVGGDTTVTTEASAWTIVKELEWAKQFHVDFHFGTPQDDFGAQRRFMGMVMALEAKMQLMTWLQQPDLFDDSLAGDYVMLTALSDASSVFGAATLPHSASNRYTDPMATQMFAQAADTLFAQLKESEPESIRELSLGIQSLVWYAANTSNADNKADALDMIADWGQELAKENAHTTVNRAYKVRGLIEAGRTTNNNHLLRKAAQTFKQMVRKYDGRYGIFKHQNTYTIDDAGTILGSINAARLFLGDRIDQVRAEEIFAGFYEGTVNIGGLLIAAPPVELFKAPFEQEEPELFLRYPTTPFPPMAGGDYGIAPVFAASVTWDGAQWSADQGNFDTAGAMHTANEMIWFHNDEVNGFPEIGN
ncbi:MAG: hypothetical protein P8183_01830 [Anaerolineae bacterium]